MRSAVFLDTVGLLAVWDADDQWHEPARRALDAVMRDRLPVVTSTFVLLECGNAAARRPYRQSVDRLRERLLETHALIVPTAGDWDEAWRDYARGGQRVMRVSSIMFRSCSCGAWG